MQNGKDYYSNILFSYFNNMLNLAKGLNQNKSNIKNLLYLLTGKIFLGPEEMIAKLKKDYPS